LTTLAMATTEAPRAETGALRANMVFGEAVGVGGAEGGGVRTPAP
jgi:hypothetical protein